MERNEHKIGEIITLPYGIKLRLEEKEEWGICACCFFEDMHCREFQSLGFLEMCDFFCRNDHKDVIFRKAIEK